MTDFGLAPYVSWGTSFTPNPGTVLGGGVAEPTTGEQVEVGVKYDLPGYNASLRAAVFDIRQENAVVYQVSMPRTSRCSSIFARAASSSKASPR